ncbi:MAG: hypothetical protein IPK80_27505 [Nannocystis sp.]|nr:hypothetical protein [Nannocystis sp.]
MIALVGGLAQAQHGDRDAIGHRELRRFGSVKERGGGELRRLLLSLKRGCIDEVWLLTCWIGHNQSQTITDTCKRLGILVRRFGGPGQAERAKRILRESG